MEALAACLLAGVSRHTQRWLTLAFGTIMMLCAGTIYLLPAWSDGLRAAANLSVSSFNTIATGLNAGTWLGVIGGAVYDWVGPRPTGIAATILLFFGYFGIRLSVQHYPRVWLLTLLALIVGQGSGYFYTVALNTSVKNFGPSSRGKIVGLMVCFFGLCSGIFTTLMKGFFPGANSGNLSGFLLFLALTTSCTGFVATVFQRQLYNNTASKSGSRAPPSMEPLPPVTPPTAEPLRIRVGYAMAILIALVVAGSSLALAFSSASPTIFAAVVAGLLPFLFVVALPIAKPPPDANADGAAGYDDDVDRKVVDAERQAGSRGKQSPQASSSATASGHANSGSGSSVVEAQSSSSHTHATTHATTTAAVVMEDGVSSATVMSSVNAPLLGNKAKDDAEGEGSQTTDYTLLRSLRSLDFWLVFCVFLCGIGGGITVVNNMFEIVISRLSMSYNGETLPKKTVPHGDDAATLLILFSVCNTFGRLLSGYVSDTFVHRLPRAAFLIAAAILMGLVQVLFALAGVKLLYLGAVLLGLAYGSFFCLVPTFVAEAFGVAHFGANFGLQGLAPAAGSGLLSTVMTSRMVDEREHHHHVNVTSDAGREHTLHCLGLACYRTPLMINAGLCLLAAAVAVVLTLRQRSGRADTLLARRRPT